MTLNIQSLMIAVSRLDEKLRPIANRPIDINDPNWEKIVVTVQDPLDQAGIRAEAQSVLIEILDAYAAGPDELRKSIRELLGKYSSFAWAATVKAPMTTADGFRKHLLKLSAVDQSADIRDTILSVHALRDRAKSAGVDVGSILEEVASISSDESISRMGSVREVLLAAR